MKTGIIHVMNNMKIENFKRQRYRKLKQFI